MLVIGLRTISTTPTLFNAANDSPQTKTPLPRNHLKVRKIRHGDAFLAFTRGWMFGDV